MAKTRRFLSITACAAAGLLAACDNGGGDAAQEIPAVEGASEAVPMISEPDPIFAGSRVPEVTLVDPAGNELALAELGEPMLVNLWATWCAPCVVEMPLLDELAADYTGRMQVITVNEDAQGAAPVERFFAEHDLPHLPRWIDADFALAEAFGGGPGLPMTILYDAQGRELWRVIGDYDWSSEEARVKIDEALASAAESAASAA